MEERMMEEFSATVDRWSLLYEWTGPWREYITAALVFLFFLALRGFITRFIFSAILKLANKSKLVIDGKIILAFQDPLKALILVIGIYLSLLALPLAERHYLMLYPIYRTLFIYFLAWGLYNLIDGKNYWSISEKYHIDRILIDFFTKVLRVLIVVLAAVMIVQTWDYNVEGFLAGLGLGGLAFALAAQDTVSNIFGGIMIIMDKPFSEGDWIETSSVEGTVEEMTFRSTKVRTFAHALVSVPNSMIANEALTNWTRMGKRRITYHLGVTYTTPAEKLKNCVEQIRVMLENHPDVHQGTIFVRFDKFSDSSLDIFLYFFTNTTVWGEYLGVKEDVNFKIMDILEAEGVSIAFPSQSIYFENTLSTETE
ncbi:mechanosensitive ion channel family protein [Dethiobacter alkaliphilus]|uniref:MscS Mechanosensitive ion channel n=1 Tax=Dethiobacter alkaliphilus AHT 1 TaxID=555088 RepID=C0GKC3_DETAL|nr:mechanosensitive ion channel family protein [Dethiobacter alkaliphilus]EEG76238.1 MscS Mechanosensitive ion channel [Dethiobacter alkaliphilus AHT 1]